MTGEGWVDDTGCDDLVLDGSFKAEAMGVEERLVDDGSLKAEAMGGEESLVDDDSVKIADVWGEESLVDNTGCDDLILDTVDDSMLDTGITHDVINATDYIHDETYMADVDNLVSQNKVDNDQINGVSNTGSCENTQLRNHVDDVINAVASIASNSTSVIMSHIDEIINDVARGDFDDPFVDAMCDDRNSDVILSNVDKTLNAVNGDSTIDAATGSGSVVILSHIDEIINAVASGKFKGHKKCKGKKKKKKASADGGGDRVNDHVMAAVTQLAATQPSVYDFTDEHIQSNNSAKHSHITELSSGLKSTMSMMLSSSTPGSIMSQMLPTQGGTQLASSIPDSTGQMSSTPGGNRSTARESLPVHDMSRTEPSLLQDLMASLASLNAADKPAQAVQQSVGGAAIARPDSPGLCTSGTAGILTSPTSSISSSVTAQTDSPLKEVYRPSVPGLMRVPTPEPSLPMEHAVTITVAQNKHFENNPVLNSQGFALYQEQQQQLAQRYQQQQERLTHESQVGQNERPDTTNQQSGMQLQSQQHNVALHQQFNQIQRNYQQQQHRAMQAQRLPHGVWRQQEMQPDGASQRSPNMFEPYPNPDNVQSSHMPKTLADLPKSLSELPQSMADLLDGGVNRQMKRDKLGRQLSRPANVQRPPSVLSEPDCPSTPPIPTMKTDISIKSEPATPEKVVIQMMSDGQQKELDEKDRLVVQNEMKEEDESLVNRLQTNLQEEIPNCNCFPGGKSKQILFHFA